MAGELDTLGIVLELEEEGTEVGRDKGVGKEDGTARGEGTTRLGVDGEEKKDEEKM